MKLIPKLTMRDLLWLTVVVALSVLLWTDRQKVASLERELQKSRQEQKIATQKAIEYQRKALTRVRGPLQVKLVEKMQSADASAPANE